VIIDQLCLPNLSHFSFINVFGLFDSCLHFAMQQKMLYVLKTKQNLYKSGFRSLSTIVRNIHERV